MYVDDEQTDLGFWQPGIFTRGRPVASLPIKVMPQPAPVMRIQPAPSPTLFLRRGATALPVIPAQRPRVPWYRYRPGLSGVYFDDGQTSYDEYDYNYDDDGMGGFFSRINPVNVVRQQVRTVRSIASDVAAKTRQAASAAAAVARKAHEAQVRLAKSKADTMRRLAQQKMMHAMQVTAKLKGGSSAPAEQVVEEPATVEPTYTDENYPPDGYNYAMPALPPPMEQSDYAPESSAEESPESIVYGGEPELNFYEGEENMDMSNVPSEVMLPAPSNLRTSGMGSIWSDLMTTGMEVTKQRTAVSIAQSQAAQADALARAEAARAAAVAASQKKGGLPIPLIAGGAAALGLLVMAMRRKGRA